MDKASSSHTHVLATCFSRAASRPEFRVNVTLSPSLTEVEVLRHDDTATPPAAPGLTHFLLAKPEAATEVTVWVSHPGSGSNTHPELCEVEIIGGESACPSLWFYRAGLKGERERERERVCVCVWERERESDGEGGGRLSVCVCGGGGWERERVCVCVWGGGGWEREREYTLLHKDQDLSTSRLFFTNLSLMTSTATHSIRQTRIQIIAAN